LIVGRKRIAKDGDAAGNFVGWDIDGMPDAVDIDGVSGLQERLGQFGVANFLAPDVGEIKFREDSHSHK
jgi:hypothetical protein